MKCIKCGHEECPYCQKAGEQWRWCDVVLENDELCCDGHCTFEMQDNQGVEKNEVL